MNAIRQFVEVKNHSFTVTLPDDFKDQKVEIIILPSEEELEIPQWQKDEVQRRHQEYLKNPSIALDYFQAIEDLKKELL